MRWSALAIETAALAALAVLPVLAACDRGPLAERARRQQSLGNLPADVRPAPEPPPRLAVGRAASADEIAAWDIDVSPNGAGLPRGSGTAAQGASVFAAKCASCHGAAGEGTPLGPKVVGREPADSFSFGRNPKVVKTVGNYWPYATTLFDYVRRSMPITAPGSLDNAEVYAVVAYLLAENGVIDRSAVMDSATLAAVKMPARDRFVPDDRKPGPGFR
jgi:S-disulfanyl-L-cysteine oxidoreductase SoxD